MGKSVVYKNTSRQGKDLCFVLQTTEGRRKNQPVMKVKDWIVIYLIMLIPIVNIVMLFIWAFDKNINPNKSNWAKASLIWSAIVMVLYILLIAAFGASILALMQNTAGVSVY
jgi:ABC-type Fe3+ transport system permease subunit